MIESNEGPSLARARPILPRLWQAASPKFRDTVLIRAPQGRGLWPVHGGQRRSERGVGARCAASAAPASARCLLGRPRGGAQPVLPAAAHASCRRQGGRGWCPPRARVEAPQDQSPGPAVETSGCTPSGQCSPGWLPAPGQRLTGLLLLLKLLPSTSCTCAAALSTGHAGEEQGSRDTGDAARARQTDQCQIRKEIERDGIRDRKRQGYRDT